MDAENPAKNSDVPSGLAQDDEILLEESYTSQKSLLGLLTPALLALARPTAYLSFPPPALPSISPPITSVLGAIHVRALECLNNLFVGMKERDTVEASGSDEPATPEEKKAKEEIVQGAVGVWDQMWSAELLGAVGPPPAGTGAVVPATGAKAGVSGVQPGTEKKIEMWNIAVGALWGLARMSRGTLVRTFFV